MKIEKALKGVKRLFLDTAPVAYFVEQNPEFSDLVNTFAIFLERLHGAGFSPCQPQSLKPLQMKGLNPFV
jgi:hypothetical protein